MSSAPGICDHTLDPTCPPSPGPVLHPTRLVCESWLCTRAWDWGRGAPGAGVTRRGRGPATPGPALQRGRSWVKSRGVQPGGLCPAAAVTNPCTLGGSEHHAFNVTWFCKVLYGLAGLQSGCQDRLAPLGGVGRGRGRFPAFLRAGLPHPLVHTPPDPRPCRPLPRRGLSWRPWAAKVRQDNPPNLRSPGQPP